MAVHFSHVDTVPPPLPRSGIVATLLLVNISPYPKENTTLYHCEDWLLMLFKETINDYTDYYTKVQTYPLSSRWDMYVKRGFKGLMTKEHVQICRKPNLTIMFSSVGITLLDLSCLFDVTESK